MVQWLSLLFKNIFKASPCIEELISGAHGEEHFPVNSKLKMEYDKRARLPVGVVEMHPVVASRVDKLVAGGSLFKVRFERICQEFMKGIENLEERGV